MLTLSLVSDYRSYNTHTHTHTNKLSLSLIVCVQVWEGICKYRNLLRAIVRVIADVTRTTSVDTKRMWTVCCVGCSCCCVLLCCCVLCVVCVFCCVVVVHNARSLITPTPLMLSHSLRQVFAYLTLFRLSELGLSTFRLLVNSQVCGVLVLCVANAITTTHTHLCTLGVWCC